MKRGLIGVALLLGITTGLATACTDTTDSGAAAPAQSADVGGTGESEADGQEQPETVSQPGVDRKLVRTATIELTVTSVVEAVDTARGVATAEGGYAGREEVTDDSATLTLHIPSDRFDPALGELSDLGEVVSRDQTAEDVTEQVVDLDSRVATQRASVERIRALLASAATVDEIVRIEQELTTREADLDSLVQRRDALVGQVAMSTVTIRISRTSEAPEPADEEAAGFLAGLSGGWDAFLGAGAVALQVLGAVLPFLLVLAAPAALALRWHRRRRTTVAVTQQP